METVGVYLKRERESKNLSLGEVSRLTKISESYLDYIEKDEFEKLPQGPYAKGYIASYSRLIGGNVDEAISLYEALNKKQIQTEDIQPETHVHSGGKGLAERLKTTEQKGPKEPLSGKAKSFFNTALASVPISRISFKAAGSTIKNIGSSIRTNRNWIEKLGSFFGKIASSWSWLYAFTALLGIAILVLAGFGFYHLFIYDPNPLSGAEWQRMQDEEKRLIAAIGSDKSAPPSASTTASATTDQPEGQADKNELDKPAEQAEPKEQLSSLPPKPETAKPQTKPKPDDLIVASQPNRQAGRLPSEPYAAAGNTASSTTTQAKERSLPSGQAGRMAGSPPESAPDNLIPRVLRASVCSEIKNRMPAGVDTSFPLSIQRVYVWNEIEANRIPSKIRHIYFFDGQIVSNVILDVRSTYWRTWSYKSISSDGDRGDWRVDIASTDGRVLRRLYFEIR